MMILQNISIKTDIIKIPYYLLIKQYYKFINLTEKMVSDITYTNKCGLD